MFRRIRAGVTTDVAQDARAFVIMIESESVFCMILARSSYKSRANARSAGSARVRHVHTHCACSGVMTYAPQDPRAFVMCIQDSDDDDDDGMP
jgi:hypothetical protein